MLSAVVLLIILNGFVFSFISVSTLWKSSDLVFSFFIILSGHLVAHRKESSSRQSVATTRHYQHTGPFRPETHGKDTKDQPPHHQVQTAAVMAMTLSGFWVSFHRLGLLLFSSYLFVTAQYYVPYSLAFL
jgi:hypothetical protein